ncbi:MAG: TonB-dependent receptor [Flavobacteriales bacterium]|nr:TonB-dependent receptor [Flavobacteriales bacterium]
MWLSLTMACLTHAQVITIKDMKTGAPLELVTLMSEQPRAFAVTNAKGQADISAFKSSESIVIRRIDYQTLVTTYVTLELTPRVTLEAGQVSLDEVVVSANKSGQSQHDVPSRVITISSKEVAMQNPQTAADMLDISGEVFVQKSQLGGGSPMIRGFATNRLLYAVDGVRMNTAIFRSGNLQNVISLDPFATESTEILFGPGSVIYGSDAIGGVMSLQTLTPQLSYTDDVLVNGKAVARYSSANHENTMHFDVNVGWKKWAMTSSISSNDFGDLRMGSHGPDEYLRHYYVQRVDSTDVVFTNDNPLIQRPSGYEQINLMQKVRFHPNAKWDVQYGFHYSATSSYARYDRHVRYKNGWPRYGEWDYGPQKWVMNNLTVTHTNKNAFYDVLTVRLAQQYFEESRITRDLNKPQREIRLEKVDALSVNLDFEKSCGEKHLMFYGAEFVSDDVASSGTDENIVTGISQRGASRYPQATWSSMAIYLTDRFSISDRFTLQGGVRFNTYAMDAEFDTTFYPFPFAEAEMDNQALTGSIGAVYRPSQNWMISVNGATGFRAPNVDDAGKVFDSEPGSVVIPNPDLQAEYAYNADLGIARMFGKTVKVDLTAYTTLLQNAMVRRDYTLNGQDSIMYDGTLSQVQAIQNAAEARVYGIQVGLEVKLPSGFGISSHFNFQRGEEELEDGTLSPLRHAAPSFGTTRLTYAEGNLTLMVGASYNGKRAFEDMPEEEKGKDYLYAMDENGNPYSPGWYTLNAKAMYQITDHFTVSAGCENLGDVRYRPYSSGIVAPGRNFILSMKAQF